MFALVLFNDDIYHICKLKDIIKDGNKCVAKYKNVTYLCQVIAQHKNITVLNDIKHSLVNGVPKIILQHISSNMQKKRYLLQIQNRKEHLDRNNIVRDNSLKCIYNEDPSYVPSNNSNESFIQSVIDQSTSFIAKQTDGLINISSELLINVSDKDIHGNIENEDNFSYNWRGNILEVYDSFERTTAETTSSQNSEMYRPISTKAYLNNNDNNNTIRDNISKNIYDENPSYVPLNTSSEKDFIEPVIDQATNSVVKQTNSSTNTSNRLHISTSLNVSDKNDDIQNDIGNLNKECLKNNKTVSDTSNVDDNDSSYIPSHSSSEESFVQPESMNHTVNSTRKSSNSANTSSGLDISMSLNVSGKCARDDTEMFVTSVGTGNKKHFCMYCNTFQSKIVCHLERVHSNELEVQKFKHMPKGIVERRKIIETIRRRGDFYFNVDCARNDGELLVERRSKKEYNRTPSDYVVCPKCKGFILKLTSRHHYQRCIKETIKSKDNRSISILGRQIIGRIHEEASSALRLRVFPLLREDDIVRVIRYDELVIAFGNQQCEKYKTSEHNDALIRQKLRRMGRLLLTLKCKNSDITDFASFYFPRYSNTCIETVNSLAGLSICAKFYKTPSLASALGGLIKEVGKLLINRCIRKEDEERKLRVEDFLKVFTEDFATRISKTIAETMNRNKRRKIITLPSKEDIIKLHNFLKQERETAYNSLKEKFSYDAWLSLTKATMTSVQVFNRRRAGEIQRTLIEDYKTYQGINNQTNDMYKSLSSRAKEIAKKYVRFTLRGKLGRTVPVLLTGDLRDCIEMILKYRKIAKVSSRNPYLFGLPLLKKDKHRHLLACDLLRQYAVECGAENPENIRGTELRKYIATICVHYNLSENEISSLANFMGHADKIHLSHYRQPVIEKEILEISQYLEVAQGADIDESDSNNSDSEISDTESTTTNDKVQLKMTTKIHNNEINEGIAFSKTIRDSQQDEDVDDPDTLPDINYLDNNIQNDQNVVNVKKKLIQDYQQRKTISRNRWTTDEKRTVIDAFGHYINSIDSKLPTFNEIGKFIKKHLDLFGQRSVPMIKTWIHNQKRIKMKQMKI